MIDPSVAFTAVRASRGKVVRAEPLAALYQQGRVHHIGTFPQLEDQMTNFTSDIDRAAPTPTHEWGSRQRATAGLDSHLTAIVLSVRLVEASPKGG
jgi:hypothetical protein